MERHIDHCRLSLRASHKGFVSSLSQATRRKKQNQLFCARGSVYLLSLTLYVYGRALCLHVCLCTAYIQCRQTREGTGSLWNWNYRMLWGATWGWKLNLSPLQEQQMFFMAGPSLFSPLSFKMILVCQLLWFSMWNVQFPQRKMFVDSWYPEHGDVLGGCESLETGNLTGESVQHRVGFEVWWLSPSPVWSKCSDCRCNSANCFLSSLS